MTIDMSITQQDSSLLDLIASAESTWGANNQYAAVNPMSEHPEILTMTIETLIRWQRARPPNRKAAGRYQFVPDTLEEVAIRNLGGREGLRQYRYTPTVQDWLIVKRLEQFRKLREWKAGSITDEAFAINLAKEFAGMPVPVDMQGHRQRVFKGQSYYHNFAGNRSSARLNADDVLQSLANIRTGGPGAAITRSSDQSESTGSAGGSIYEQSVRQATGGDRLIHDSANRRPATNEAQPVTNPYTYRPIDPLDNRYDFRTGEKVREYATNGVLAQATVAGVPGNGLVPTQDDSTGTPGESSPALPALPVVGNTRQDGNGVDLVEVSLPNGGTQIVTSTSAAALAEQQRQAASRPPPAVRTTTTADFYEWHQEFG
jgi:hypothetical protein